MLENLLLMLLLLISGLFKIKVLCLNFRDTKLVNDSQIDFSLQD